MGSHYRDFKGDNLMIRTVSICIVSLFAIVCFTHDAYGELLRGGATLSSVSSVIKINREGNGLDSLVPGEILYVFTESGEPVSQIFVKDVFSDVIHSEPLPDAVARQIRETNSILIFSNLKEYGDYMIVFLDGSKDSFRNFITQYPGSELREEAQRIFDGLVYRPYKIQGTPQALDEFPVKFPDNSYVESAIKKRDDLQYMPVKAADRISLYRWFLSTYPANSHTVEARERIEVIHSTYEDAILEEIARFPNSHLGKKVRFPSTLHSALPIYVDDTGVGRKADSFKNSRNAVGYLNFQVTENDIVCWTLFASRESENLVKTIQESEKGDHILVYGVVFDTLGGAPWIDVDDIERY
jgi:hypothetical protein